jgi:serralysin
VEGLSNRQFQGLDDRQHRHYTSTLLDNVAGSNTDFEALETTFNEDLNGDSVIGVWTIVESSGMIRSDLIGNHYFLDVRGAPPQSGPSLKDAGVPITPGFSGMNAIGAELLGTGYEVAFKAPGADLYSVWFTNSNGNHVSTLINAVSGTNWNLESAEWDFNQDLNGDGMIGLPAIETSGFTRLDLAENHYFLDSNSGAQGRR